MGSFAKDAQKASAAKLCGTDTGQFTISKPNQITDLQYEITRLQAVIAELKSEILDLYRRIQF